MPIAFGIRMSTKRILAHLLLLHVLLGVSPQSIAANWGIVLNGKAIHIDADRDWNENNWGLGFEREFNPDDRWVKLAVGGGFVDSQDAMSYMAGGGLKRRFRMPAIGQNFYIDVGAVGFFMTRRDIDKNRPFPGVLPTVTFGTRHVALNLAYLPGSAAHQVAGIHYLDPNVDGIYFLQMRLSPGLFSPMRSRLRTSFAFNRDTITR